MKKKLFDLYTLLIPVFIFVLLYLHKKYALSHGCCYDGSVFIHYLTLVLLCCIGIGNAFLFKIFSKDIKSKINYLWIIILNCVFCGYAFAYCIERFLAFLIIFPAIITIPIQAFFLSKLLWKELLQKKVTCTVMISSSIIIAIALFLLLCSTM